MRKVGELLFIFVLAITSAPSAGAAAQPDASWYRLQIQQLSDTQNISTRASQCKDANCVENLLGSAACQVSASTWQYSGNCTKGQTNCVDLTSVKAELENGCSRKGSLQDVVSCAQGLMKNVSPAINSALGDMKTKLSAIKDGDPEASLKTERANVVKLKAEIATLKGELKTAKTATSNAQNSPLFCSTTSTNFIHPLANPSLDTLFNTNLSNYQFRVPAMNMQVPSFMPSTSTGAAPAVPATPAQ